jgi:FlaA1/EpsC-like NDP-sugar epimerase
LHLAESKFSFIGLKIVLTSKKVYRKITMCTISDFYVGQKLLVTGATGFMGKVLIEKLLRACPDLDSIYILVRDKKGKTPEERWQDITQQTVWQFKNI